jgi:hypothetical protein
VGVATRDGDLAAVRSELATLVDGVKEEQDRRLADHAETERVSLDAVAKRLDRMEDKLDRLLEARR